LDLNTRVGDNDSANGDALGARRLGACKFGNKHLAVICLGRVIAFNNGLHHFIYVGEVLHRLIVIRFLPVQADNDLDAAGGRSRSKCLVSLHIKYGREGKLLLADHCGTVFEVDVYKDIAILLVYGQEAAVVLVQRDLILIDNQFALAADDGALKADDVICCQALAIQINRTGDGSMSY